MEELTASANYLPEPDENGKPRINPEYYKNIINDRIDDFISRKGKDPAKINGNDLMAAFVGIRQAIFKYKGEEWQRHACNVPYTVYNIKSLLDVYINIAIERGAHPSLFGFSWLTGIDENTVKEYLTPASLEILNIRREMLRNSLADDRMGRIVLANNDSSYGLEYEKKQATDREQIRQLHTANELPQLTEIQ